MKNTRRNDKGLISMSDLMKKADYSTQNKKKRFVETEIRQMIEIIENVKSDAETYLDGAFGICRQRAILNYLDKAEEEFKSYGLDSVTESMVRNELLPFNNYNNLDSDCGLRIGAALWILNKLRESGKMMDAYKHLPDVSGDIDAWCLPIDFFHPCYSSDLIQSVIHVMTIRYGEKRRRGIILTEENVAGKKPGGAYAELLKLLPEDIVSKACDEFKNKLWDLMGRFLKGQAYYDREIRNSVRQLQNSGSFLAVPFTKQSGAPFAPPLAPFTAPTANPRVGGYGSNTDMMMVAAKGQELVRAKEGYALHFDDYIMMERKEIRKETGSREIADAVDGFMVSDPYELCFALIHLLDAGDDAPWLMKSGYSLMYYVLQMLPWYQGQDDWDDGDWNEWYDGLTYNKTGWLDREPVPDQIDFYHEKHNGRNMAQVVYDLCRGIVPTGLHPFEEERKRFIAEGMDEDKAREITDKAELLFLTAFQAKQRSVGNEDFSWLEDADEPITEITPADTQKPVRLGGYWGKVMGMDNQEGSEDGKRASADHAEENASLRLELDALKKQLKTMKNALAVAKQDASSEKAKYEHELKALRMEHRELADLRELVFNSEMTEEERARREKVKEEMTYPYETRKRTVIFGGHETWLKAIRPMLPGVKFVDLGNYAFNPDIVRNADVVWVQNNCISHTQYGNIVKMTRQLGIQLRYFAFGSAEKCAEQLVVEDRK